MNFWPRTVESSLVPLKHACVLNPESLPETTDPDYEIEYVDIGSVSLERGIESCESLRFADSPSRARKSIRTGDIIIATVRTYLKAIALVDNASSNWIASTGFAVCRPQETVDFRYLYRVIQANPFVESVVACSTGVSYPAINPSTLGGLLVPLPDLPTQQASAAFLDRETARIDKLIAKKERLTEILGDIRSVLIISAVTGLLNRTEAARTLTVGRRTSAGPFPESVNGWSRTRLQYCLDSVRNGAWGSDEGADEKDVVCLRVADFAWNKLGVSLERLTVRSITHDQFRRLALRGGDILLEKSGGGEKTPVGRIVRFEQDMEAITSNFVARLRPSSIVDSHYLTYLLAGLYMSGYSHQFIKQNTGIQNLDDAALFATPVLIPGISEQRRIVSRLEKESGQIARLQERIQTSVDRLRELRSALITAAVTGQIDVTTWGKRSETDRRLDAIVQERATEPAGVTR